MAATLRLLTLQGRDVVENSTGQDEHHRTRTFQEEYLDLLRAHGVQYDVRYLW
ncbi:MAG: hypothetical protein ACK47B_14130 [Armatimonadota bacterium]